MAPYNISKTLAKRGHHVTIYTSDYKISQEWIDSSPNIEVFPSKTRLNLKELLITPSMWKYTKEGLKDFDVIHMHNYRTFQNIVVHHYAKKYGVPYVLQAHGSLPRIMAKQRLKWIYDFFFGYSVLRDASRVIALSRTEAEQYRDMGVPEEKIEIIPNGIDLSEYNDLPPIGSFKKKFNIPIDKKIILYLGRINKIKGIDILVNAFANINEKIDNAILVIVGPDDGYLKDILHLTKVLNIVNRVFFTGPLYGEEKLEAFVDSDIFVLPSRYEIFGISVIEAYCCGKPIVVSKVGGLKDLVIDGVTGLLFTPGNIRQLTESLIFMLEDRDRANKMGLKGRKLVMENFTIEKVVDRLEILYNETTTPCTRDY